MAGPLGSGIIAAMAVVLHVCVANQCRSVLAEALTRYELDRRGLSGVVQVASAGTRARPGIPPWPPAVELARDRGWPVEGVLSRPLDPAMVMGADLVLAATRRLRDEVVAAVPSALRRTFTWAELAWLVDGAGPADLAAAVAAAGPPGTDVEQRLRALPALATGRRGRRPAPPPHELDVADPVASAPADQPAALRAAADRIVASTAAWLDVLTARP